MTERERLIELINQKQRYGTIPMVSQMDDRICDRIEIKNKDLADYLLANDVIVPPCKVGQILYAVDEDRIFQVKVMEVAYCSQSVNGIHFHIRLAEHFYISEAHFGKTVFLTEEEAVQALKEGGKE